MEHDLFNLGLKVTRTEDISLKEIQRLLGTSRATVIRWKKGIIPPMALIILEALRSKKITVDDIVAWRKLKPATKRIFGADGYDHNGFDVDDFDRDGIKRGYREEILNRK